MLVERNIFYPFIQLINHLDSFTGKLVLELVGNSSYPVIERIHRYL